MGSITYYSRVLAWYLDESEISIWTLDSRQRMSFVCGDRQCKMLESLQGEADLVYRDSNYYLHQPCSLLEDETFQPDDVHGRLFLGDTSPIRLKHPPFPDILSCTRYKKGAHKSG